jgi:hypothetical protein
MVFLGRDRARQTFCVFKRYRFAGSSRVAGLIWLSLMDRYLGSQVLWRLGAATLIITCGLMLERMLQMVDLLVKRGMPLRPVASMLAYLLPYSSSKLCRQHSWWRFFSRSHD